jgi:DNA-directed RNA polymerase specialized sigma24 family protein
VPPEGSITRLIGRMKSGDEEAARRIWLRYSPRLAALAQQRLPVWLRCVVDGEDVANSAMGSAIMGLREGRFPNLRDRDGLWALLAFITASKAINAVKSASCQKRRAPGAKSEPVEKIAAPDLAPDLTVMAAQQFELLIDRLRRKEVVLEAIALWKFEGYTNGEIAERLGCSRSRIDRKLALIRMVLESEKP